MAPPAPPGTTPLNSTALLMKQLTVIAPVKVIKVYHHDGEVSPFEEFFRLVFEAENLTPPIKGQLILKCLFGVFNSSKKRTKTIRLEVS